MKCIYLSNKSIKSNICTLGSLWTNKQYYALSNEANNLIKTMRVLKYIYIQLDKNLRVWGQQPFATFPHLLNTNMDHRTVINCLVRCAVYPRDFSLKLTESITGS